MTKYVIGEEVSAQIEGIETILLTVELPGHGIVGYIDATPMDEPEHVAFAADVARIEHSS